MSKAINPKAWYIVDISSLKQPRIYTQEYGGLVDALEIIEQAFYGDYENTDIMKGSDVIAYGLKFKSPGYSQWMGSPRFYSFPYSKIHDFQGEKSWRTLIRRKMREDFLKDLNSFIEFITHNQDSYVRTFRIKNTGNIYYLVNSLPNYIKERYYKVVMDCIVLHPDYKKVAFLKTKILESDFVEPIKCGEFLKLLQNNLRFLLNKNRYHPALIKYEKLGLTRSRYNLRGIYETTERILEIRINL